MLRFKLFEASLSELVQNAGSIRTWKKGLNQSGKNNPHSWLPPFKALCYLATIGKCRLSSTKAIVLPLCGKCRQRISVSRLGC